MMSLLLGLSLMVPTVSGADVPLEDRFEVYTPLIDYADVGELEGGDLEEDAEAAGQAVLAVTSAVEAVSEMPTPEPLAVPLEVSIVDDRRPGPRSDIPYNGGTRRQGRQHGDEDARALTRRQVRDYDRHRQTPDNDWKRGSETYREGYLATYEHIVEERMTVLRAGRIAGGVLAGLLFIGLFI